MTQRVAILNAEVVINIGVFPDDFEPDGVTTAAAEDNTRKGDTYRNGAFIAGPPRPVKPEDPIALALRDLAQHIGPAAVAQVESRLATRGRGRRS